MAVAEKAKALKAAGRDIISFSIGVPNFLPGPHIYAAAAEALAKDSGQYGSNRGADVLLDAFLGHPRRDPHGDPIPDKNGYLPEVKKTLLSEHISGQESILVSVKDASDNFLKYLNQKNISLGAHIKVIALEPFDGSMTVEINDLTHYFSPTITTNLYVQSL